MRSARASDVIATESVPARIGTQVAPLTAREEAIFASCDGWSTVAEIATATGAAVDAVREVLLQLEWYGMIAIEELIIVDEIDLIDERTLILPEPQPILLSRRKPRLYASTRLDDESPLVSAIRALAELRYCATTSHRRDAG